MADGTRTHDNQNHNRVSWSFADFRPLTAKHSANARRSLGESSASPRHRGVFASRTNKVRTGVRMRTDELRSPTPSPDDDCWLSRFANRARTLPPACTTRNAGCLGTGPRFMGSSLSFPAVHAGAKPGRERPLDSAKQPPWGCPRIAPHRCPRWRERSEPSPLFKKFRCRNNSKAADVGQTRERRAVGPLPVPSRRLTIAVVTNEPSTATSSKQTTLQLLAVERARLDELQRRAPSLTAHELRERLDACRHQIEDINRRLA